MSDKDEITFVDLVEFEFPELDFVVVYEDGIWYAKSNDPDIDDIIIIEDKNSNIFMTEDVELFGNYILTKELFNSYKKEIGEKIQ